MVSDENAQLVCDINQERVLFQGSCYAILKQGPCAAGFVVAYRQDTNTVDCVKDVCGMGKVLWTDGKCYPEINQDHLCTGNLKLFKNKYNLGECGCAPGTVLWEPLNQCFPVFRRGPCEQGEILILNNSPEFEENQLVCEVNPCPSEDYLLLNGRCYERSDHSGCTNGGFLDINYETLQPDCVDVLTKTAGRYSRLRCPSGYRRNKYGLGECRCASGFILWEPLNECFEVFRRGPCEEGEILILSSLLPEFEESQLACEVNPCPSEDYLHFQSQCYHRKKHRAMFPATLAATVFLFTIIDWSSASVIHKQRQERFADANRVSPGGDRVFFPETTKGAAPNPRKDLNPAQPEPALAKSSIVMPESTPNAALIPTTTNEPANDSLSPVQRSEVNGCNVTMEEVYFRGRCYQILKEGPCETGEIVAYNSTTNDLECIVDFCSTPGFVYWPANQTCIPYDNRACGREKEILIKKGPCDEGQILVLNRTEESMEFFVACQTNPCTTDDELLFQGQCPCPSEHILAFDRNTHKLICKAESETNMKTSDVKCRQHEFPVVRGPCDEGSIVTLTDEAGVHCSPNVCPSEGLVMYNDECQERGSQIACIEGGRGRLDISRETWQPQCSGTGMRAALRGSVFDCPPGSKRYVRH
ncbi:unnamed protein product [Cyprideis torosa]|uniref:DUF4789 domain-containing protein n=1 Tax=Cyprideis torosa TaxID=163714 RepID=A0A7R8WBC9_9CRUS|nr:unnamed protein product [Cyprideis torosa]CAG0892175.1 unnamed protein product [Cyprideis torosa]